MMGQWWGGVGRGWWAPHHRVPGVLWEEKETQVSQGEIKNRLGWERSFPFTGSLHTRLCTLVGRGNMAVV